MKRYFRNYTMQQYILMFMLYMSLYLMIINTTKNIYVSMSSKNMVSAITNETNTKSLYDIINDTYTGLKHNIIKTNLNKITNNVDLSQNIKVDTKITYESYEFDYIPGAPYSVYEAMAKALNKEKESTITKVVTNNSYTKLTASSGVNYFGDQKETYYNLPMEQVVYNANNAGISGEYWIRSDGCKMLGQYIMIAANQSIHPYGSLVETSLGTGIVVDTGGFAESNPYQVDIAVTW